MKIEVKSYGNTYTVETERDDLDISEVFDILIGILQQQGFHKETIDDAIIEIAGELNEDNNAIH